MSEQTITYVGTLMKTSCWCGIHLAVPSDLYRAAKQEGRQLHCPLGHVFVFKESEADRLRRENARLIEDRRFYAQRLQAERDLREHTEKRLSAQKAATTRAKKRHAAGVCPCCKRTFSQLARHMASKHPDYDAEKDDA